MNVRIRDLIGKIESLTEWQAYGTREIQLRNCKVVLRDAQVILLRVQLHTAACYINFSTGARLKLVRGLIIERLRIFYLGFFRLDA
jgi:hypothetical protein